MKNSYLLAVLLAGLLNSCSINDGDDKEPDRGNLRIAYVDSVTVDDNDDARRLPENLREICAVLLSDNKSCNGVYILDPTLIRLDQDKEFSLKTIIEKGGAKKVTHPKVVTKLIDKHLEEIDVPKEFTKGFVPGKNASLLVAELLTTKAKNDSILVFSEEGVLQNYSFGKKSYRVFSDVGELRKHMLTTLCQNDKVNFTLLMNPPEAVPPPPPPVDTIKTTNTTGRNTPKQVVYRKTLRPRSIPPNGICDYTTHTLHEKVVDATGHVSRGKVLVVKCAKCGYEVGRR